MNPGDKFSRGRPRLWRQPERELGTRTLRGGVRESLTASSPSPKPRSTPLSGGVGEAALAIALATLALIFAWVTSQEPNFGFPILTDFARDLMGVDALRVGRSPYARMGELASVLPEWEIAPFFLDHWIAHPPSALALARLMSAAFGDHTETVFKVASLLALGGVLAWIGIHAARRYSVWFGIAIAASASMSFGLAGEIWFLNGASIAGVALIGFYHLEQSAYRRLGLVLLGVLIAWRPWLAPLALFLRHRRHLVEDLAWVGGTGAVVTLVATVWLGRIEILRDWIQVALPANVAHAHGWPINMSLLGSFLPAELTSIAFVAVTAVLVFVSRFVDRERWSTLGLLAIVIASPLVWPQYWWNLTPVLVIALSGGPAMPLLLVLLGLSAGVAGLSAFWGQICLALIIIYLFTATVGREKILRAPWTLAICWRGDEPRTTDSRRG